MKPLFRIIFRNRRIMNYLGTLYDEIVKEEGRSFCHETSVQEVGPIFCRESNFSQPRLNLLVPSLAAQHLFGGINTALILFDELGKNFSNLRIILTEQQYFRSGGNQRYAGWDVFDLEDNDAAGYRIIAAGNRFQKTLPVGINDRFVATAWWTAVSARAIQQWQAQRYRFDRFAKFAYLIQDFEPGFYPWSSRYALAESTYHYGDDVVAIFNTSLLQDFFFAEGYRLPTAYAFEPVLHPELRSRLSLGRSIQKERRVLVYGRPSVHRNAFELIVMALRNWTERNPNHDWTFVSAGEAHPDVNLGHGHFLASLGKVSIEDYAMELARAAVGISLMISPHPSYPPLEMAAYGVRVITNRYKQKNLSLLNSNIYSLNFVNPSTLSQALETCIIEFETETVSQREINSAGWSDYIKGNGGTNDLEGAVVEALFSLR